MSPVLEEGKTTVDIYVPDCRMFDYYTLVVFVLKTYIRQLVKFVRVFVTLGYKKYKNNFLFSGGEVPARKQLVKDVSAPEDYINLHIRGGSILIAQEPAQTTFERY